MAPAQGQGFLCELLPVCPSAQGLLGGAGGSLLRSAAGSLFGAFGSWLQAGAAWLLGVIGALMSSASDPEIASKWFLGLEGAAIGVMGLMVVPLLLAGTMGAVLRQDLGRLLRIWGVALPAAILGGLLATEATRWAMRVADVLSSLLGGSTKEDLARTVRVIGSGGLSSSAPGLVVTVVALAAAAGAFLLWLELVLRSAAVYLVVFFMPVALAGLVWPATSRIARRLVEVLVALVFSKVVVAGALSVGAAALAHSAGASSAVTATGVLLLAAFAPYALLRVVPLVEVAAISHLEGLARRPLRAAARAPVAAWQHPVSALVRSHLGGAPGQDPAPVRPMAIPEREPAVIDRSGPGGPSGPSVPGPGGPSGPVPGGSSGPSGPRVPGPGGPSVPGTGGQAAPGPPVPGSGSAGGAFEPAAGPSRRRGAGPEGSEQVMAIARASEGLDGR